MPHLNLTFTDANATALPSHDANWTPYSGVSAGDVAINDNAARRYSGSNGAYFYDVAIGTTSFQVDFDLEITLVGGRGGILINAGIGSSIDGYLLRANPGAGQWQAYKVTAGSFALIADGTAAFSFTANTTYAVSVQRDAANNTVTWSVDGAEIGSFTDADFKANDRVGLRISDGTNIYIDNIVTSDLAAAGPSITAADDITTEGQSATFTLSGNTAAPVSATLNGEPVGTLTAQGSGVYSYTAPLVADDDTADLVVSVDGTTATTTIAYANSYDRDQLTHPATKAEYSENSLSYPNAYATTQVYEWKVIADANASVVTIDWDALEADDGFHKDVASYASPVANGSTTVTLGVFVPETGDSWQFDRTITVTDGSVEVSDSERHSFSLGFSMGF